jgi:hypothetical protein
MGKKPLPKRRADVGPVLAYGDWRRGKFKGQLNDEKV